VRVHMRHGGRAEDGRAQAVRGVYGLYHLPAARP
jgi:hypothetical protein